MWDPVLKEHKANLPPKGNGCRHREVWAEVTRQAAQHIHPEQLKQLHGASEMA